ncbi:extracellular ligand-binding receptor [Roseivivax marinus]|jgi:branched-chain amino acid transport system substrate-binding protein|uniref:Extracellular ligand-binding receptor n=1 Tax=Roseivivax marinus TaxID=1379903 RepID=W4HQ44_9RHOB|nr:ABC transporter substrate-binding protein [Roseivivax marinus]ETW14125.1 extracellular ligand-binding receptor [Roseivivax marinus]UMA63605.1 ABC transporter substrate-binding protein [Roseivivax marinus]SEL74340.1 amino acid/amide ABC transporter substrate-binding protein, HAAT family [Roseivivax marinus]
MRHLLLTAAAASLTAGAAFAESHTDSVKMGVLLSFTGPIESLTPAMAAGAEMAISEASGDENFMGGMAIEPVRGDATCVDAAAATAAAERMVTSDGVTAIMGADCSGVTTAVLANVAVPNGISMISPSATSPALTEAEDDGLFFRTAPSDARQGEVLAAILSEEGISSVAVTYTNNDYGKGFADAFQAAFEEAGGEVTIAAAHEDGKGDYSAEVGALASAGGDALVVLGYVDQGGAGVMQSALDTGAFDLFALGDGMIGDSLTERFGTDIDGTIGTAPGSENEGGDVFADMASEAGIDGTSVYAGESYDAAALTILAMAKAGSASASDFKGEVMGIANAPGEQILPGELSKALQIIADGGEVDYQGATGVEFVEPGEAAGSYAQFEVQDGALTVVGYR